MRASLKTAEGLIGFKFRKIFLQLLRFHLREIQGGESRRVAEKSSVSKRNQFGMTSRIFSSSELSAQLSRLHMNLRLHEIGKRRFARAGGTGHHGCLSLQPPDHRIGPLLGPRADQQDIIAARSVDILPVCCLAAVRDIFLVETDEDRDFLFLHRNEKPIQKAALRVRIFQSKENHRLVNPCHGRANQRILSWKNLHQIR